jgi:guanine deaminase
MQPKNPISKEQHAIFMKRAIELSRTHMLADDGGPFGAVIVKDGKIIAEGWNQVTSTNDPTAHAEVQAIRNACKGLGNFELVDAELYTSCEPCPMCLAAAYWARISKIYYANTRVDAAKHHFDDEFIYQEIPKALDERSIPMVQVSRDEAYKVFNEWDQKLDKIKY